jgi:hypothetical protein
MVGTQVYKLMKPIQKDEIYENVSEFLKNRGIELTDGTYTKGIQASCSLLAEAINMSQAGLERAKTQIERQFETMREVIHQKTAPKSKPAPRTAETPATKVRTANARSQKSKPRSSKTAGRPSNRKSRRSKG